jgi:hypothetical protein
LPSRTFLGVSHDDHSISPAIERSASACAQTTSIAVIRLWKHRSSRRHPKNGRRRRKWLGVWDGIRNWLILAV